MDILVGTLVPARSQAVGRRLIPTPRRPIPRRLAAIAAAMPLLALSALSPLPAVAQEPEKDAEIEQEAEGLDVYDELEVRGRADDLVGIAASSGEGATGRVDLARRPILRPGELVETTPGVIATQHSGGGKANQYFLRGFNLDHGTDFSITVDGVPVNMPTHGHGQGYSDLNFLIPELVDSVRFRKGPYSAEHGDFSSAGSADFELVRSLDSGLLSLTGGSWDYGRLLYANSIAAGSGDLVAGIELFHNDGPWRRGDDFRGGKALLRFSQGDGQRGFSVTAMGYDADWLATDQIPQRLVESGALDRFDLVDPGPRGSTRRMSLSAEGHRGDGDAYSNFAVYVLSYDFQLFSNFTYFLEDPENGDQFEQIDDRTVLGGNIARHWTGSLGGRTLGYAAGVQLRYDDIANGLFRTRDLARLRTVRQDDVRQLTGGPWAEATLDLSSAWRAKLGLRADFYDVEVDSDLGVNSGSESDVLLSPKLALIYRASKSTELYFNAGWGHHSNDARGATIRLDPSTLEAVDRVDPLVRSRGLDVGLRTTALPGLHSTLTFFALDLDSELLFVGDGGSTEASRPSRRMGVEWTNFYRVNDWLTLDLDVTYADAEFRDDDPAGDRIPGAVERTLAAGLSVQQGPWSGSLRWRYFGGAPLIEDGSVEAASTALVNAEAGYTFANGLGLRLEIFNLLDREGADIQYYYASRLANEPEAVDDIHFHPLEKRSARLVVTWRL